MTLDCSDEVENLLLLPPLLSLSHNLQVHSTGSEPRLMHIISLLEGYLQPNLESRRVAGGNHSENVVSQKPWKRKTMGTQGGIVFLEIWRQLKWCVYHFKTIRGIKPRSMNTWRDWRTELKQYNYDEKQTKLSIWTLHNTVRAKLILSQERNIDSCLPLT